jgi:hypothetical protein
MSGLDCLGTDEIGAFDYMSLLSGAGGMLSGFGGGGKDAGAAEKARLEEEKRRAEKSASTMKMALLGLGAVVLAGGIALLVRRPAVVAK